MRMLKMSLLLVLAAVLSTGCKKAADKSADTGGAAGGAPAATSPPPEAAVKPDFSLTTDELLKQLKDDKKAAMSKYNGKVLEITGPICDESTNFSGDSIVRIGIDQKACFECWVNDPNPWAKLSLGQQITVVGTGDLGFMAFINRVTACTITKTGNDMSITATAQDLAAEYKANPKDFEKQYKDKTISLTGTVEKKTTVGGEQVWLKGTGGLNIGCYFMPNEVDRAAIAKLNPGDTVTIRGMFHDADEDGSYWLEVSKVMPK